MSKATYEEVDLAMGPERLSTKGLSEYSGEDRAPRPRSGDAGRVKAVLEAINTLD